MAINIEQFIVPPRKETLSANIAAQIKSLIFKKKFKTGDKLPPERELAKLFDVSRVVIKQALIALEQSGFIEVKLGAKGGTFVNHDIIKPITVFMEDLQKNGGIRISHFQDVRRALECAALQSTIHKAGETDLAKLAEINREFAKPKNRSRHGDLNIAFHIALAEISGNPLIKILLSSVMEMVFNYPGPTISAAFIKKAYDDHEIIISAIRKRDISLAQRILVQNIDLVTIDGL